MTFAAPLWLLAGLVACGALAWSWRRFDARQETALRCFVAPQLQASLTQSVSRARRLARRALALSALALLFVALAGPRSGYRWEQVTRRGNDILLAVDTSRSMLTPDVKPNRLARAKLALDDFVSQLDGDAVGLIAFAGSAFLQCPLTVDYAAFHDSLDALDTDIIPRGGTNIAAAIREAQAALHGRSDADKILILVTDGEDLEGEALAAAKTAAQQDGLRIFTVGVGTAGGELIPLPADQGGGFVKDAAGQFVKSRLDEPALRAIAAATGGSYAPLGPEGQGLESLYRQALAPLAKHDLAMRQQRIAVERYQWPLAAALALLLASLLIGGRRRAPARDRTNLPGSAIVQRVAPVAAVLLALLIGVVARPAQASAASAASAYAHHDFAAAAKEYAAAAQRTPREPVLRYDAGTAEYRDGEYAQAAKDFEASLAGKQSADAARLAQQQSAYYNLGNTLYRSGQQTEQHDPARTIQSWTQAVKSYDAALQLRGDDADSKFNRDFVQRRLEALQRQQSQQQQANGSGKNSPQPSGQGGQQSKQGQQDRQGTPPAPKGAASQTGNSSQGNSPSSGSAPTPPAASSAASPAASPTQRRTGVSAGSDSDSAGEEAQRAPGQMSAEEARELLDSVKDEERHYPGAALARSGTAATQTDQPTRNW